MADYRIAGRSPVHRPPTAGAGSGRNYGSVGYGVYPPQIDFTLASGEVALISWVRVGPIGGDIGALVTSGPEGMECEWVELAIVGDQGVGSGWMTGVGACSVLLHGAGSLHVDIDTGTGQQASSG